MLFVFYTLVSLPFANCSELGGLHYVYWDFPIDTFTSLSIDVEILTEPSNEDGLYFQMYQGKINGVGFYFGLQTQTYKPGYGSMGKGLIFSRWETTDLSNVRVVEGGWAQSAGYEGDFVGVRRTYGWTTHAYRLMIALNDTDNVGDWYGVWITDINMQTTDLLGAIRFPKMEQNGEYGIADGGITWTELYWKAEPGSLIPSWHVSIVGIYAGEQEIPPYSATSFYSEIDHTDIYFDNETREIHFIMGSSVTRTHSPGILFEGLRHPNQYQLTRQVVGSGTAVSSPCRIKYLEGTEVSVEARPESGWVFDHWILDDVDAGTNNPINVIMNTDHTLEAVFEEIPPTQHQLTIQVVGSGTTNPTLGSHMYDSGSAVSVDAQPDAGWKLDHWLLDGVDVGDVDPYEVTMDVDHTLRAVFVDISPPAISILSPKNKKYAVEDVPLSFSVSESTSWIGYSLDGQVNKTISGNTTLTNLSDGSHHVVVYANDTFGNIGASNTVYFTVDTTPPNITEVSQIPLSDNVLPEDQIEVKATIIDDSSGVEQAILNYNNGNGTWVTENMTNLEENVWNATIPAFPYGTNVTYRIIAEDNMNNTITTEDLGYEYQYTVIPEFPSFLILSLFMIATLLAVIIYRRKHSK